METRYIVEYSKEGRGWMVYDKEESEPVCFVYATPTTSYEPAVMAKRLAGLLNAADRVIRSTEGT